MKGFETVYWDKQFEVLRAGRARFYLKVKGGLRYAAPGLTEISRNEAEKLIQEHVLKELKRGQEEAQVQKGQDREAGTRELEDAEEKGHLYQPLKEGTGRREFPLGSFLWAD